MGVRESDIVVFGATGYVGALTAGHLAEAAPPGTRIALAGRSADRLAAVRDSLGEVASGWPLITADSGDAASLAALAERTAVVATTVGPYATYGLPLVAACAAAGTHYADLTGEALFVRRAIDASDAAARTSGARIVVSCGFDSVPSDLGVLALHRAAQADGAGDLEETTLVVRRMRGGLSGGTAASLTGQLAEMKSDRAARALVTDPYSLSPDRTAEPDLGRQSDLRGVGRDAALGGWTGPFVMSAYNTRIVRRSNALLGHAYGRAFRYQEVMSFGEGPAGLAKATAITAGMGAVLAGAVVAPKGLLAKAVPAPGTGPSAEDRARGFFDVELHTVTSTGARYVCAIAAQGDPGYAATSVMIGQSALALALDDLSAVEPGGGGLLTPATGIGEPLADRLRGQGFTLTVTAA